MDFSKKTWQSKDDFLDLYKTMHELSDEKYKEFNHKIVKSNLPMMGIRMPILKKIAAQISRSDWQAFLEGIDTEYYEFIMLKGLVITYAPMAYPIFLDQCHSFADDIENWAVCDCFCSALSLAGHEEDFFEDITAFLESQNPWHIRLALVAMLSHYLDEDHLETVLCRCDSIHSEYYYVRMAQAWLISIAYIKNPAPTLSYLKHNTLDDWTFNKCISKIRESYRVSKEDKAMLNTLKRPVTK